MYRISLSDTEVKTIKGLLNELASQYDFAEEISFLKEAYLFAHEIPRRIRALLNDFKFLEPPEGVCVISGYPVDNSKIGRTPQHWKWRSRISPTFEEEALFILLGSLLGDVFGWSTQQDGHVIQDVFPIPDNEEEQISTGSKQTLTWHNEDAFHTYRGDYLGLLCLRNPDGVATTVAPIDSTRLDGYHVNILFEPRFIIRPDISHLGAKTSDSQQRSNNFDQTSSNPPKMPVLFGDPKSPYVRIDPYFMDPIGDDVNAQRALDALVQAIDATLSDLVLRSGDYCFMDNYRVVHGRRAFQARYDGNDRWLKRINITRDLRKSRSVRSTCTSRIIL